MCTSLDSTILDNPKILEKKSENDDSNKHTSLLHGGINYRRKKSFVVETPLTCLQIGSVQPGVMVIKRLFFVTRDLAK